MYSLHNANHLFRYASAKICESIETKEKNTLRKTHTTVANITTLFTPPVLLRWFATL